MKIAQVVQDQRKANLSPLKRKVLDYLDEHDDEVFRYGDEILTDAMRPASPSAVNWTLWWLVKNDHASQMKAGRVYFGSKKAVEELVRQIERSGHEVTRPP